MSADLALSLLRRNARFRAWRAYGVPVEGGWALADHGFYLAKLRLSCSACGWRLDRPHPDGFPLGQYARMSMCEEAAVKHAAWCGCPHLAPLLGDDPPEVQAIAELELLSLGG